MFKPPPTSTGGVEPPPSSVPHPESQRTCRPLQIHTFHQTQAHNKEAFSSQRTIPNHPELSMLHLVSDATLKKVKPEDEEKWAREFAAQLIAASRILSSGEGHVTGNNKEESRFRREPVQHRDGEKTETVLSHPHGLPTTPTSSPLSSMPKPEIYSPSHQSGVPSQAVYETIPSSTNQQSIKSTVPNHRDPSPPPPPPIKPDPSSPTPSLSLSPTLTTHLTTLKTSILSELHSLQTTVTNLPTWSLTPSRRRQQLHRWFGLYTIWEKTPLFTEEERREWRRCCVVLARDLSERKGSGNGVDGRVVRKRRAWFGEFSAKEGGRTG